MLREYSNFDEWREIYRESIETRYFVPARLPTNQYCPVPILIFRRYSKNLNGIGPASTPLVFLLGLLTQIDKKYQLLFLD
jgi:hypothetical protein